MFVKTPKFIRFFFPSLIWEKENTKNEIWLTFDDGPSAEATPFILKILKELNIKATFFLIGKEIENNINLYNNIIANGHLVANHSYSHKNGYLCNNLTYFNDIAKCQKLIPNNKLFRPPYGKISPLQIKYLKKKYKLILWDVLSWDFSLNTPPKKIKTNVLKNTKSGSIIVFHNNKKALKNLGPILKETLKELKQRGFIFSTTW